ncbi:DUF4124 domain-containing protein, partial [Pseudomonas aeruginosa]
YKWVDAEGVTHFGAQPRCESAHGEYPTTSPCPPRPRHRPSSRNRPIPSRRRSTTR